MIASSPKRNYKLNLLALDEFGNDEYIKVAQKDDIKWQELEEDVEYAKAHIDNPLHEKQKEYWEQELKKRIAKRDKYVRFGYRGIDYTWNNKIMYPVLYEQREFLNEVFVGKYGRYILGYNSYVEFTVQLQNKFDRIAPVYEKKFKMWPKWLNTLETDDFSLHSKVTQKNAQVSDNKMRNLPDVLPKQEAIYHSQNAQQNVNMGETESIDESLPTKLNVGMELLSMKQNLIDDYLNEYINLFQTMVW